MPKHSYTQKGNIYNCITFNYADGRHLLKEDDFALLMEKLYDDTVTKWYSLGMALGVKKGQLNVIRDSHKTSANPAEDCLREMLDEWLNNTDQPTWEDVAAALERKVVSRRCLAQTIRQKYCGVVSQGPSPRDEQCDLRSGRVIKSPRSEWSQGKLHYYLNCSESPKSWATISTTMII